ncbi:MAG TPA: ROK family transcriptional regulator [Solirubrobacteraceae bacterium]|nr:ROK family transcriptional regulator [Solirubrobacteraceae bacterium]
MAAGRTGSLETLRRLNRLRVIDALRDEGLISRAEIARRTGLSRSTVSSLVSELQADGLVVERSEPAAAHGDQGGRPPILLSFDASAGVAVGIDFDHHHVRVAISDLSSRILVERELELDTDHAAHEGLDAAAELVTELLGEAGVDEARVIGAGMCLPGPIHRPTGVVGSTAILPGWVGVAAADEMHRRLDLPILVDNDANLAALAEAAFGAGRDAKDLVYLMISSGIGAGLVLNGRLYRGAEGLAGELGHVLVDADGPVCRCGNRGCLETVAGTDALADLLRRSHGDGLDGRAIVRLAREGDLGCRRVIADAGRAIGQAAATLVNVLNPELLIVGGDLSDAGELLLDGVRESLERSALPTAAQAAAVVAGSLGDRAEVLGAIALVLSEAERDHPLRPMVETR